MGDVSPTTCAARCPVSSEHVDLTLGACGHKARGARPRWGPVVRAVVLSSAMAVWSG
jgi:hypothetical protein